MDIYKTMTVWELLSFLKSRVKENVDQINLKISELREFRKMHSHHPDLQIKINKSNQEISKLTDENNRLLGMFNELLKFHNSHLVEIKSEQTEISSNEVKLTQEEVDEYIDSTVTGVIPINEDHPLLINKDAVDTLLEKLLEREMYEACATLQQIREIKGI